MQPSSLEAELEATAETIGFEGETRLRRGQAGRYPARRLESKLRSQGFIVTQHFLDRLRERAQAQGIRFNAKTFGRDFAQAPHFRQTRPGYNTRIARMQGLPVLYRMGGPRGRSVVLVGLLPQDADPPRERIRTPQVEFAFELEPELEAAASELELESEAEFEVGIQSEQALEQPEGFWPTVLRVAAVGAHGAAPLFRVAGRALAPAAARTAARRLPGVFVQGTARQVRSFAQKVGGTLVGPERHGAGLPHFHLLRNGDRIHVWFGRKIPKAEFFE